ncbi:MFS general substrate transporter [Cenococcum geophilum 1.58]|uniref:MFS general substrate transporter n=1 Tax=Cenococcum geophilum 1.58 TaxID=794803 RepID=UPI00358E58B6|nr:MFS general substrate transporter [Cenococcum geophilum 1.58]
MAPHELSNNSAFYCRLSVMLCDKRWLPISHPFGFLDAWNTSVASGKGGAIVMNLRGSDEALAYLENHPRAAAIAEAGNAILEDPMQLKELERKIDRTTAMLLTAVYFLQFLDKTTLSYTAVMEIRTDTHLKRQDYSDLSMLFNIGFSQRNFLRNISPSLYHVWAYNLGVNIMIWGFALGCHAACTTFAGLTICRTLPGVFESYVAPILVLVIALWYKEEQQGRRVSWFYVCNSLTTIFGGFLTYGVGFAKTNFARWRIFFHAIGALTIIVGALVCVFLPDLPVKAKRFTDAEKVTALMRVKENQSSETFKGLRVYLICLATFLSSIPNGGISNFSSILLTTFGYSPPQALVLNTPTGLMIGLDPNGTPKNKASLLAASFLTGIFGAAFMNIAGHSKEVTTNALTLVSFAVGNILGTQTFQQKQAPGYISGKISIIATLSAKNERALAEMGEVEREELRGKTTFEDRMDRRNVFKYTH